MMSKDNVSKQAATRFRTRDPQCSPDDDWAAYIAQRRETERLDVYNDQVWMVDRWVLGVCAGIFVVGSIIIAIAAWLQRT